MKKYYELKSDKNLKLLLDHERHSSYFYPLVDKANYFICSQNSFKIIKAKVLLFGIKFREIEISQSDIQQLRNRINFPLDSFLHDPVPANTLDEIYLILISNPRIKIEYIGRNLNEPDWPYKETINYRDIFCIDIMHGKRKYFWKVYPRRYKFENVNPDQEFSKLKEWFSDPDSKVVLSLGSGGMRMFAAPTVLKILDLIDVRQNIAEVWGCSGGSIVGGYYANGIAPQWIEQFAYDLYNDKFPEFAIRKEIKQTIGAVIKNLSSRIFSITHATSGIIEVQSAMNEAFLEVEKRRDKSLKTIPFYAIASNPDHVHLNALCEKKFVSKGCEDFLVECSRLEAICASSAIPYVFNPLDINPENSNHPEKRYWTDGMMSEEVPLIFPYIKNSLENASANGQRKTRGKKLKIFYIHLSARSHEIGIMRLLRRHEKLFGKVAMAGKLLDKVLDSSLLKTIHGLNMSENIEVIGVNLNIGRLAILDITSIPYIITEGRKHFLEEMKKLNEKLKTSSQSDFVLEFNRDEAPRILR